MADINASELFGKNGTDNLSEKSLKRAKKKELVEIIESNLPFLVEYYFNGKVDRKYLAYTYRLVCSNKYFINPLEKLIKDKKRKGAIPKGLHVILVDSVDKVRAGFNQKIAQLQNATKDNKSEMKNDYIEELRAKSKKQEDERLAIAAKMVKKETKAFIELGIDDQYAKMLALATVPKKYLNERNIARYIHGLNMTLMRVMTLGMSKDTTEEGEERFINSIGVNLADRDVLNAIYGIFLRGVSRKVYLKALLGVLLERRSKANQFFTKPQRAIYNAISNLVTDTLEGENVINNTGKKLKKKDAKDLVISKKELKKIMTAYSKERLRDMHKGNDSTRRIIFKSLAEDAYPNLLKVFKQSNSDAISEDFEGSQDLQQPNEDNRQKDNNGNNNRNNRQNNRNSNKKN